MAIRLRLARSSQEKDLVYQLRHRVFVEEERRFSHHSSRVVDRFDCLDETLNILAYDDDLPDPLASLRLTLENPVGLPAAEVYDNHFPFTGAIKGVTLELR